MEITRIPRRPKSGTAAFVHDGNESRDLLSVVGNIDPLSHTDLSDALASCLENGRPVIVDLRNCQSIGSLGLTALLRARNCAQSGFSVLITPGSIVQRVFEITNLERALGARYDAGTIDV